METNFKTFISKVQSERNAFTELFLLAGVMALCIGLLASLLAAGLTKLWVGVIGSSGIITCLGYLFWKRFGSRDYQYEFRGFMLHNKDTQEILRVDGYDLSNHANTYLEAAFHENPALKVQWMGDPLEKTIEFNKEDRTLKKRDTLSAKLLRELLEYIAIQALSTHLNDYFNAAKIDKSALRKYERSDIPDILLSNRFLELFSKPMTDRASFVKNEGPMIGTIVSAFNAGALYSRFDLTLPLNSTVKRRQDGGIEISSPLVNLMVAPVFQGMNTHVPEAFLARYVGIDSAHVNVYQVGIQVTATVKLRGIFSGSHWMYHNWVESFFTELDDQISTQTFMSSIQWPAVEAALRCLNSGASPANPPVARPAPEGPPRHVAEP